MIPSPPSCVVLFTFKYTPTMRTNIVLQPRNMCMERPATRFTDVLKQRKVGQIVLNTSDIAQLYIIGSIHDL